MGKTGKCAWPRVGASFRTPSKIYVLRLLEGSVSPGARRALLGAAEVLLSLVAARLALHDELVVRAELGVALHNFVSGSSEEEGR